MPSNSSIYYHLADANKMKETINDSFGIPDFFLPVAPINGSGYQEPPTSKYSIPRSPCGERPVDDIVKSAQRIFQSTLPVWGATSDGYDAFIDLDKHKLNGKIKSRICVKGSCTGCPYFQDCGYRQYIQSMFRHQDLDFQVTNHNLYLMAQKSQFDDDHPTLLRRSCFVVVDEAHKFREAATDIFGERINEKGILRYVNGVKLLCGFPNSKTLYNDCLNRLIALNSELFDSLRRPLIKIDYQEYLNQHK